MSEDLPEPELPQQGGQWAKLFGGPTRTEEELKRYQAEEQRRRTRLLRTKSGLPPRFVLPEATWTGFRAHDGWAERLDAVAGLLVPGQSEVVVVCGAPRTGKSTMAVAALGVAIEKWQMPAFYCTADDYLRAVRGSNVDWVWVGAQFEEPLILVVDEVAPDSDWDVRAMFNLVNKRQNAMLHTVLVVNGTPAEAATAIGPRIAARLRPGRLVHLSWKGFSQ